MLGNNTWIKEYELKLLESEEEEEKNYHEEEKDLPNKLKKEVIK